MSVTIQTTRSSGLPDWVASEIARKLSNPGSEMHRFFVEYSESNAGSSDSPESADFPMSICLWSDPYTDSLHCLGWVSVTQWDRALSLQGFVDPEFRHRGLAHALVSILLVDGVLNQEVPVAVFADSFFKIAKDLSFLDIRQYARVADGWIRKNPNDDKAAEGLGQE